MNSRSRSHVQLDVKAPVLVVPIAMTTVSSSGSATGGAYSELLVIDLGRLQLATVALADMKLDANDVVSKAQQLASPKAVAAAATAAVADVDAATADAATVPLANGTCACIICRNMHTTMLYARSAEGCKCRLSYPLY
jgi:hypothetical protein